MTSIGTPRFEVCVPQHSQTSSADPGCFASKGPPPLNGVHQASLPSPSLRTPLVLKPRDPGTSWDVKIRMTRPCHLGGLGTVSEASMPRSCAKCALPQAFSPQGRTERFRARLKKCSSKSLNHHLPGKPVAHNYELLSINNGLLWSIVASFFGLLGVPGRRQSSNPAEANAKAKTSYAPGSHK